MYSLSFDPGKSNLGVCLLNISTLEAKMYIFDLTTWSNRKHDLGFTDLGEIVHDFLSNTLPSATGLPNLFSLLSHVCIERQPVVGTREILQIFSYLHMGLMCLNKCPVFLVDPRLPRGYWDTKGKSYKGRKQNSWKATGLMSTQDMVSCKRKFKSRPDALEATQLAVYVLHKGSMELTKSEKRDFLFVSHTIKVLSKTKNE